MKTLKNPYKNSLLSAIVLAALALPATLQAQDKEDKKEAAVKNMIESKEYVFKAQTALPTTGRTRQLTSDFDLRVSDDTLVSYLPYFGRAFSAPFNPSQGPLNFTSTKFDYKVTERKKGGWDILIQPKDMNDPRSMAMTVFDNGSASLTVTSNNRQQIAFNGYITSANN